MVPLRKDLRKGWCRMIAVGQWGPGPVGPSAMVDLLLQVRPRFGRDGAGLFWPLARAKAVCFAVLCQPCAPRWWSALSHLLLPDVEAIPDHAHHGGLLVAAEPQVASCTAIASGQHQDKRQSDAMFPKEQQRKFVAVVMHRYDVNTIRFQPQVHDITGRLQWINLVMGLAQKWVPMLLSFSAVMEDTLSGQCSPRLVSSSADSGACQ